MNGRSLLFPMLKAAFTGLLFLLSASATLGSTWVVTNIADSGPGSLRGAIANASNGDTIDFDLTYPATITVLTPLAFGPNVTITGPGASNLTISGGNGVGVFIINAGAIVTISGVSVQHGSYLLGGCIFNGGTLNLDSSTVSNCTTGNQLGGGIFNSGTLNLNNSQIENNVAGTTDGEPGFGGGIYNYGGTLTITNSALSNNSAIGGEQLMCEPGVTTSCGYGGGIYNNSTGTVVLSGSDVSGNFASGGGGIMNDEGTGNTAKITMTNSTVSGNSSIQGGNGIVNFNAMTIIGSTISGNTNLPIAGLEVGANGGGILNGGYSANNALTILNSTIWGNSVIGDGGGGISSNGKLSMAFVTIAGNSGGGIFLVPGEDTLTGAPTGPVIVKNSILASNILNGFALNCSPLSSSAAESGVNFSSLGYNLSDDSTCAEFLTQTGDLNSTPAGLNPNGLQNNGGPTETVALLATSRAIDAIPVGLCTDTNGNPVTTDQRGVTRPQGSGCDIGAFEYFKSDLPMQSVLTYGLINTLESFSLSPLIKTGLTAQLDVTVRLLNQGDVLASIVELGGFIIEVDVLRAGQVLTSQQASSLTTPAQAIVQSLLELGGL